MGWKHAAANAQGFFEITISAAKLWRLSPPPRGALDVVLCRNRLGLYCVPRQAAHRPAARAVIRGKVYEPRTVAFLTECEPEADLVHAGTFFGDFLPVLARSRKQGAQIWAFEPNPHSYKCAQLTVLLNQLDNVLLHEFAVSDDSRGGMLVTKGATGRPLGGASYLTDAGDTAVRTTTIDSTVSPDRRVGVIQLDVEGHEAGALAGAAETIARWQPTVVLESVPAGWAETNGYELVGLLHRNSVLVPVGQAARRAPAER